MYGTATTEIYTLSLHDALPISNRSSVSVTDFLSFSRSLPLPLQRRGGRCWRAVHEPSQPITCDRKAIRLNSSHAVIPYAVICLREKMPKYDKHDEHLRQVMGVV